MKKQIKVGNLTFGQGKIYIQSMLNARSDDFEGNIAQAKALQAAGCDIIRVAVPDARTVPLIAELKKAVDCPIVADIHFDYRLALASIDAGVDKLRINPGNIGSAERVKALADKAKEHGVPIRIGVNSGSLQKEILAKYGSPTAEALAESALTHAALLEECDFSDIVISIKSSDVATMVKANRIVAAQSDYPLHLGVTEAGTPKAGTLKSAIGIGSLLLDGIGDTIRVSLTGDVLEEVAAARSILSAVGLMPDAPRLVSCPTCGRTKIDVISLAKRVEEALADVRKPITVAVMGCVVNGPGEARGADIGIAGGDGEAVLFKKGEIVRKISESELFDVLMKEINEF